jgi:hypothetical protein
MIHIPLLGHKNKWREKVVQALDIQHQNWLLEGEFINIIHYDLGGKMDRYDK